MSAEAHGHEKDHGSHESLLGKSGSFVIGGFTKAAFALGAIVGGVIILQAAVPMIAVAAANFLAGSIVVPNSVLAAGGAGVLLGAQAGKGKEAPKKEKPAAHGH